jgi:hypothetical protein
MAVCVQGYNYPDRRHGVRRESPQARLYAIAFSASDREMMEIASAHLITGRYQREVLLSKEYQYPVVSNGGIT